MIEKYTINVKNIEVLGGIGLNLQDYPYQPLSDIHLPLKFLFIGRVLKEIDLSDTEFTVLGAVDHHNLGTLQQTELNSLISSNIIQYPGHVSNIKDWIADSHVFVLPSYREGVPRSTQEAMANGRSNITTDVPGCRETVEDGVNGFLVPKWDPEALAEKMIYFIEHPEQVRLMGAESSKIAVEKFDAEKVNQRLVNILGL